MPEPGLKKFLKDQEESVQLARDTIEGSDPVRVDALNAALALASINAGPDSDPVTMKAVLKDADEVEKWLLNKAER